MAALFLAVLASVAAAAPALGSSPWWHATVLSRPSYLQAGQARNEVQEVRLSSEEGIFALKVPGKPGAFAVLPANASAAEVQQQLEGEALYGAHNVNVTAAQGPPGGRAYQITFNGALEAQSVALIESREVEGAQVTTRQVTEGRPDGVIMVNFVNRGEANLSPVAQPVTVADVLPAGMKAVAIEGAVSESIDAGYGTTVNKLECELASVSCVFTGQAPPGQRAQGYPTAIAPYFGIQLRIAVKLTGAQPGAIDQASASGGNAPPVSVRQALAVNSGSESFGVSRYEMSPEEPGGAADTQAGSHPFQLTTTLMLNDGYEGKNVALPKDLSFKLPPGLIGNPQPFTRCSLAQFLAMEKSGSTPCPAQSVVGVARIYATVEVGHGELAPGNLSTYVTPFVEPLFNLEPEAGEPARFGFAVIAASEFVPVLLDTSVRTGGDYGVTVNVSNITQSASFVGSEVTFWGVPGDERHNDSRGEGCIFASLEGTAFEGTPFFHCASFAAHASPPLLSLPGSCTGPLLTSVEADSWLQPGTFASSGSTVPLPALDGCNRLPFTPSIKVTPDGRQASKPTGLNVDVHVPQEPTLNPAGLAESEVRSVTVALPEGVAINPAGGDGLAACSEGLVGYEGTREAPLEPGVGNPGFSPVLPGSHSSGEPLQPGVNFCPDASKIGTVTIHTPLLPDPLTGSVYLASQEANPFGALVAMYIVAEDPAAGTLVKLPGVVHLAASGQIVATFEDTPQLPFEDAELHFFGGERAPLASPARCGSYQTQATYTPWSGTEDVDAASAFEVTSGPNGSPCPGASLPFAPSLTAGTPSIQAGGFSPFTMTMSREDGQQSLQAVTLHLPEGLSGLLAGVELCGEAQADAGTCGPGSQIGETTVSVGLGGDPFTVTGGKVFITGPYKGAPFGLSIVNPAKAGPFDLEHTQANHPACDCLVVRAKLAVDPTTAAITVTSDNEGPYKIPTMLEGIPLQIKHVNVTVGRPGFIFNPTSCEKKQITGTLDSAEGASQSLSVPFQATNCAVLGFKPKFAVSTSGKTSRVNGASLHVKLTYPPAPFGSQANVASVKVELPKAMPSRLTTLQKACTSGQFRANPAGCPQASIVGHAKALTPLVPVPLEGPAYFVSNGNESFPNLIVVLQGYGVTIDLVGDTFISRQGITSSTFKTVPDAPVGSFELTLPEGPYSALTANRNLCNAKLQMPTEFIAQNGAQIKTTTKIAVSSCPKAKKAKKKHNSKQHKRTGRSTKAPKPRSRSIRPSF